MLHHSHSSPQPPERVVVLGAGGFVGGALVARLRAANVPVLPVARRDIDLIATDAASRLAALLRPGDAVVAASAKSPCKSSAMLAENMTMTHAMLSALSQAPVAHVVNISSDAVYADLAEPLTEASVRAPNNFHGIMHVAREVAFASEVKAPLAILRPSMLYGVADPHNSYGPNMFRRLANARKPIVLFGDGEERRDHVSIDDVAEIIFRVLQRRSTGALNIVTGHVHSFRQVAEMVVALADHQVEIKSTPRSGPMPHNGYRPFDIAACRTAFPDFSYTPLKAGLAKAQRDGEKAGEWRK
jgi:UDP-glucose 4-epimerase